MLDEDKGPEEQPRAKGPSYCEIRSKYELVMSAAKESERINEIHRRRGTNPAEKVTVEAVQRIRKGLSRIAYEDLSDRQDEPLRESTYFFGS